MKPALHVVFCSAKIEMMLGLCPQTATTQKQN